MESKAERQLLDLAERYGTPLYVYDAALIRRQVRALNQKISYRPLRLFYAMKANFNPHILKILHEEGACIDAVSPGDVLLARRCGFADEQILFTANNISEEEMHAVAETGVLFNIGSLSRLKKFAKAYPGRDICIRLNPDVVAGAHENIKTGGELTKFGILLDDLPEVLEICKAARLRITGIHKHTGSGIRRYEDFLQAVENVLQRVNVGDFPDLEFLDFGGGFHVPYEPHDTRFQLDDFGIKITERVEQFCEDFGRELSLAFEPGKFLVAEAGNLLVEVNTIKRNRSRTIAGTNSGFPQLIRPVMYDAFHQIDNLSNREASEGLYDICGNICESGDNFAKQRAIAEIREGDILCIRNAGAYCYSMGGYYNLRPMPGELVIEEDGSLHHRPKQSFDQLIDTMYFS